MAHRVTTLLIPGANAFEFAVACEVFGLRRPELDVEWYDHRLAAVTRPLVVNGGWTVNTPHGLEAVDDADTVIVPACPLQPPPVAVARLRQAYERIRKPRRRGRQALRRTPVNTGPRLAMKKQRTLPGLSRYDELHSRAPPASGQLPTPYFGRDAPSPSPIAARTA